MFDVTESNDFVKTLLGTRASPAPRSNLPVVHPLTAFSRASFGKKKVNNRSDPRAPPPIPFLPTAKAIDEYIEQRQKPTSEQAIDARLVSIVERMFQRCFDDGQIHQAIGVALETKRLDKLEEAIHTSTDVAEALNYATKVCQTLVTSREFRREVLTVLVRMYESDHVENNYLNVCQCLMFLDDADGVAAILTRLVEGEEDDQLLAYQIAFSLCENEIQKFLSEVASKLAPEDTPGDTPKAEDGDADMEDIENMCTPHLAHFFRYT